MRRLIVVIVVAASSALLSAMPVTASAAAGVVTSARSSVRPAVSWGKAEEVPGIKKLDTGQDAAMDAMSCASSGNCAAGGYFFNATGGKPYVVSEKNGRWRDALAVTGLKDMSATGLGQITSVSCPSAGYCAAVGYYPDAATGHNEGFAVKETKGTWGTARGIPGATTAGAAQGYQLTVISCPSAGNCVAAGFLTDASGNGQSLVASEKNGHWGSARVLPNWTSLQPAGSGEVASLSCASAGNCSAGGWYTDAGGHEQGFVATMKKGKWGKAIEVPGLGALNAGEKASVVSVSCGAAGDCVAGGSFIDLHGDVQGFVAAEKNGTWHNATKPRGSAALNAGGDAAITSVSCRGAGNCTVGGYYTDKDDNGQALVASEKNGMWDKAAELPGSAALNTGGGHPNPEGAAVTSVSCQSAGNCAAGGYYRTRIGGIYGFVASQRKGVWGKAIKVPGLGALHVDYETQVNALSCPSAGACSAGGYYAIAYHGYSAYVVSQT